MTATGRALADFKKITIVAEAVLLDPIKREVIAAGATGMTIASVEGQGTRGLGATTLDGENVRIETIVEPAAAEALMARLADKFFENYAVIAWMNDVKVMRSEKFAPALKAKSP
jgi:nitrogen regulatory protein P-II 2